MSQSAANRRMVTLAASPGWFFDAYIITICALSLPLIAAEFHISTNVLSGTIGSVFLVGYTIGTIAFGLCVDIFGRRIMLDASIVGDAVVTAPTSLVSGPNRLAICRFLAGIGGGGELSIGNPYAHGIAVSAFIRIFLRVAYVISHETVGIEICDQVLPMPVLQGAPE